nr:membrane protein insertase YidC [Pseudonocardia acidicola]
MNFIYYPVSAIMWFWHKAFGFVFGEASGIAWALSVVFLVFTLRALLYKPFVSQVRSMRKMQEFAPEIQKLKKKYGSDRQKMAAEMQKLQSQQGVNPLGGCLPVLVQVPVFIGLFHVLREFRPGKTENYFFGAPEVESFNQASLFGAKLGAWVTQGDAALRAIGTSIPNMLIVMIPLMIAAGIFTHITARHSVARQTEAQAANPQAAIMNKLMLYVFPIGVVVGAPFLPLAVLLYWVSNNLWTLGQQYFVYKRIDAEETAKREEEAAVRQARAPRPGQKPNRGGDAPEPAVDATADDSTPATEEAPDARPAKKPGAKPVTSKPNGTTPNGAKPTGKSGGTNGSAASRNGRSTGGGSRPPAARRGRKRR